MLTLTNVANLAEWKQRIIECRASGQPVKTWCKNNDCTPSTYYRWEREVKQLTSQKYRWLMEGLQVEQQKAHRPVTGISVV